MKRIVFFLVIILVIGGLLFWLVENNDGSVLISTQHYVVQFSLWVALIMLVVGVVVLRLLYSTLRALLVPGMTMLAGRQRRRHARWRQQNNQGLLALAEGRWDVARRDLLKTADKLDDSTGLISYIAAANAAAEKGEIEEALATLKLAEQCDTDNIFTVSVTRARILVEAKRYQEAVTQLVGLQAQDTHHPFVLGLLAEAYSETGAWDKLERLLPDLERSKVLHKQAALDCQVRIRSAQLQQLSQSQLSSAEMLKELEQLWSRTQKPVKAVAEVVGEYVRALAASGELDAAESVLRKAISKNWDNGLALQYGNLLTNDPVKQLISAESWLRHQPDNAALLLALGRLCKRNKLWGKGRDYLEASLTLDNRPETCAELATVLIQLGEEQQSVQLFKRGLLASLGLDEELMVAPAK
jgi:HemY protein